MSEFGSPMRGGGSGMDEDDAMESLAIDDSLTMLEKIKKYINSDIMLHRLYLVRSLADAARQIGYSDSKEHLIPIMELLLTESDPSLRQALVEQIPDFSRYLIGLEDEAAYTLVLHILVPMVAELTTDRVQQVRASAGESLIQLANMIRSDDLEPYILPIVKSLANDNTEEEHRLDAVNLLASICPVLEFDLMKKVVLPHFVKLAEDPSFRVRKAISASMGQICKSMGQDIATETLLPLLMTLCEDDTWGVRKACADSLAVVASSVTPKDRCEQLMPLYEKLMSDSSRWVKSAAFQNLGPFIATFTSEQITPSFLRNFCSMALDPTKMKQMGIYEEATMFCGFNFPAVLTTVGNERWGELKDTYMTLVRDNMWKVRKTLSHSLHEVAKILGTAQTEASLLPMFELFLKDLDEVKVGVLGNISSFLAVLSEPSRRKYLPLLVDFQSSKNWRFRKLIAKQLDKICGMYSLADTEQFLVQLVLHLCLDAVADVRKAAAKGAGVLLNRLIAEDSTMRAEVQRQIVSYGSHPSCYRRQLFLVICNNLVEQLDPELFDSAFLPKILSIHGDKVDNVRIGLSQLLQRMIKIQRYANHQELLKVIEILKQDQDPDVSYFSTPSSVTPRKGMLRLDEQFIPIAEPPKLQESAIEKPQEAEIEKPQEIVTEKPQEIAEKPQEMEIETTLQQDTATKDETSTSSLPTPMEESQPADSEKNHGESVLENNSSSSSTVPISATGLQGE
eukprot:TRINITY_DN4208_c0_g1_i4.p1 TRINITY_DN4208_c0_g1~~TRINITY_DN4208_c0_g1_i4.p1  ORF type:complete len:735 (+),score=145.02 TRINITY_DN4208_c0_g1_i4:69-2273(+)